MEWKADLFFPAEIANWNTPLIVLLPFESPAKLLSDFSRVCTRSAELNREIRFASLVGLKFKRFPAILDSIPAAEAENPENNCQTREYSSHNFIDTTAISLRQICPGRQSITFPERKRPSINEMKSTWRDEFNRLDSIWLLLLWRHRVSFDYSCGPFQVISKQATVIHALWKSYFRERHFVETLVHVEQQPPKFAWIRMNSPHPTATLSSPLNQTNIKGFHGCRNQFRKMHSQRRWLKSI